MGNTGFPIIPNIVVDDEDEDRRMGYYVKGLMDKSTFALWVSVNFDENFNPEEVKWEFWKIVQDEHGDRFAKTTLEDKEGFPVTYVGEVFQ